MLKAFDAVNYNIMLRILQHIGVTIGLRHKKITERKYYVVVGGMFSTLMLFDSGILQGSNLDKFSIFLYLNDLSISSEMSILFNICDDAAVFLSHPSSDALYV